MPKRQHSQSNSLRNAQLEDPREYLGYYDHPEHSRQSHWEKVMYASGSESIQSFYPGYDKHPMYRTSDSLAESNHEYSTQAPYDERQMYYPSSPKSGNISFKDYERYDERDRYGEAQRSSAKRRRQTPSPPRLKSPTSEYLATSLLPSGHLTDPSSSRKLLILDLNGTLLFRSPHTGNISHLRPVHPRPYIPSFRKYLFHPSTKEWLDTMVWSSAQPHSVADMVDKCFGGSQEHLVAVWARDTLDLEKHEYHRKTQTTKDLAKPWGRVALPSSKSSSPSYSPPYSPSSPPFSPSTLTLPPLPHSPPSSTPSPLPPSSPSTKEGGSSRLQTHSALTTLLLDDSPLKAHLQPWNHVCIREYVGSMRAEDVNAWEDGEMERYREAYRAGVKAYKSRFERNSTPPAKYVDSGSEGSMLASEKEASGAMGMPLDKSRLSQGRDSAERSGSAESDGTPCIEGSMAGEEAKLAYKRGTDRPVTNSIDLEVQFDPVGKKTRKKVRKQKQKELLMYATEGLDKPIWVEPPPPLDPCAPEPDDGRKFDETLLAVIGILDAVKNESNVAGWIRNGGLYLGKKPQVESSSNGNRVSGESESQRMWFEDDTITTHWVSKGRSTLRRLGIEAIRGVQGHSQLPWPPI